LKAVSEPWAVVGEATEDDGEAELKRQTRIMAQSWHVCLHHLGNLIRERRYGFVWEVFSHKILRWLSLPILTGLGLSALFGLFDFFPTLSICGLLIIVLFTWIGSKGGDGIARVVWMFVVLHWAAVLGFFKFAKGEKFVTWSPRQN